MRTLTNKEKMKTLVIVDVQHDFCHPDGALYVPGGEKVIPVIKKYIEDNKDSLDAIIFTQDWHPLSHCSFKENGGQWPVHCVAESIGAAIPTELLVAAETIKTDAYDDKVFFAKKGQDADKEEYGAFLPMLVSIDEDCHSRISVLGSFSNIPTLTIATKDIVVCGLALDFCVNATISNLLKAGPEFQISLLKDGCACIGGEEKEKEIYEALTRKDVQIV